jgi:hypothetical protein
MGYVLVSLLGKESTLQPAVERYENAVVIPLTDELALLPITTKLSDELHTDRSKRAYDLEGLWELSPEIMSVAAALSHAGLVAYLEAEFFGGTGSQAVLVWETGEITFGPFLTGNEPGFEHPPLRERAFNRVLQKFGVSADDSIDGFGKPIIGLRTKVRDDKLYTNGDDKRSRRARLLWRVRRALCARNADARAG